MSSYNVILENFKAIGEMQKAPVRPLTLIFGPNSAGKSSFIHSILLVKEALESGNLDVHHTKLSGDSVDIGGFRQYVFGRNIKKTVKWGLEFDLKSLGGRLPEIFSNAKKIKIELTIGMKNNKNKLNEATEPILTKYAVLIDDVNLISMSDSSGKILKISNINTKHYAIEKMIFDIIENYTTTQLTQDDYLSIENKVSNVLLNMNLIQGILLPTGIDISPSITENPQSVFPIGRTKRNEEILDILSIILPWNINEIISGIYNIVNEEMKKLSYLGPLRSYPPRHFTLSPQQDTNWFAGGGESWEIVQKNKKVREKVNRWLGSPDRLQTPYELIVRELVQSDEIAKILRKEIRNKIKTNDIENILESISNSIKGAINNSDIERLFELVLFDKRSVTAVSHRDVGIGISQILPVLVNAYASSNKMIAIEQPELHLHPALQAELGDVLIESALGENRNTFILETHSEHLILRIMRRIRESSKGQGNLPAIKPSDVSIIYVEPMQYGKGSMLRFLELDDEGELLDSWPGGFFEEGFRERFS